jgi:hypothetical protein
MNRRAHTKNRRFLGTLRSRKAQMEMIGLVVIVILITLGMLFMAQFYLKEDPTKKIFTRKGLAYSTLTSLMKTTVDDTGCVRGYLGTNLPQLGQDVLEDCAININYPSISDCGSSCRYQCSEMHSCQFFNQTTTKFLNLTLGKWGKNYEFKSRLVRFEGSEAELLIRITSGSGCPKTRDRDTSGIFPLSTDVGTIENELYLCD